MTSPDAVTSNLSIGERVDRLDWPALEEALGQWGSRYTLGIIFPNAT
jgi:hypothetical protein